jgi:peptidyl-tRNA hydrolase
VPLILYTLVRTDMPSMGYGKGAAQAQHAATTFSEFEIVRVLERGEEVAADVMEWRKSTKQGFGTKLTLACPDAATLDKVVAAARKLGFPARVITDPTYPYLVPAELASLIHPDTHVLDPHPGPPGQMVCYREEQTCAYVFGEKDEVGLLLGRFNLLPNEPV